MEKKLVLDTPAGVRDYNPEEMKIRNFMLETIRNVFELYNSNEIDTSIFEFNKLLQYKYGDDEKLIFNIKNSDISLRYDLTVPLVRYLVMNKIEKGKFFRIGKVYRCDTPIICKARLREFYQCDFDIIGNYDLMFTDAECIYVIYEILTKLGINNFIIRINNRKIIDSIFNICKIPKNLFNSITSSIDKLDKCDWEYIKDEMIQKGLSIEKIDNYKKYFNQNFNIEELNQLFIENKANLSGLQEIKILQDYLNAYEIMNLVKFDISLVRGLDYYTGTIFEVIVPDTDFGSIAAGGRYDKLINSYNKSMNTPCVGMSIGFERVFLLCNKMNENKCKVLIVTCGKIDLKEKLSLAKTLRNAGIGCDMNYKKKARVLDQFQYAEENNILYCILLGENEIKRKIYKIRITKTREEIEIPFEELISYIISTEK